MTTSLIAAVLLSAKQDAPFQLQIVALPFPTAESMPAELVTGDKVAKFGTLKATTLTDFAMELNRLKPTIFIAHLQAGTWLGVNCYLHSRVSTGESEYTLASVSKIKSIPDGYEIETTVSDGDLKSNLTFTGGKFNHRDKFKLQPGEIHYRSPRGKLKQERILLLFTLTKSKS